MKCFLILALLLCLSNVKAASAAPSECSQILDIAYPGVGVARQKPIPETALDSTFVQKARYLTRFQYEVGFWEVKTLDGKVYFSDFFTSRVFNLLLAEHAIAAVNLLLQSQKITLADLESIALVHNHPLGSGATLSVSDREIIFDFSERIKFMQNYPPVCSNKIKVGIYSIHPAAPGLLFYSDTEI